MALGFHMHCNSVVFIPSSVFDDLFAPFVLLDGK